jgi:nitrogen fixation NifU-like protein
MADARGYDDLIMDHIRNARGYGAPEASTHRANGINPLCGDEMTVYAALEGERIANIAYQCSCCGISMASASMMSEYLRDRDRRDIEAEIDAFANALLRHAEPPDAAADPMRHALLKTVRDLPARTPCAALPWAILSAALKGQTDTVSVQV